MQQERQNNGAASLGTEGKVLFNASERHGKSQDQGNWRGQGRGIMPRSQGTGRGRNPNYGKQCSYFHKMNHIVEECYSKHGYPLGTNKEMMAAITLKKRAVRKRGNNKFVISI